MWSQQNLLLVLLFAFFSFFSLPPPPVYHIVLPTKFVSFVEWVTCILNWYPFGAGGREDGHVTTSH